MKRDAALQALRADAAGCTACDLYKNATQTVFGEGPASARLVLVGEQPGDREDLEGEPFVGPAGRLLDDCLERAGINRSTVYVTNAVKHFKWRPAGKRRIHQKPNTEEVRACRQWLEAELTTIRPDVTVCLGATAAQDVLGPKVRVTRDRGQLVDSPEFGAVVMTVHPSSILRERESDARHRAEEAFVADLIVARHAVETPARS